MAAPPLPDFLKDLINPALQAKAHAGINSISRCPYISIERNRFTLVDAKGDKEMLRETELDLIVVDTNPHLSRIYYGGREYDPNAAEHAPPDCFSDNGVGPSVGATKPQNPTCDGCAHAVWGSSVSKVSGKGIPSCRQFKKLLVLYNGEAFMLGIPPNSLQNWATYVKYIEKHAEIGVNVIYTRVTFDEKVNGTLNFGPVGYIDEKDGQEVRKLMASGPKALAYFTGADDKPRQGALPAPVNPNLPNMGGKVVTLRPTPPAEDSEAVLAKLRAEGRVIEGVDPRFLPDDPTPAPTSRGRGRPPGSTNKPKVEKSEPIFGMQEVEEADPADETGDALAKAMNFLRE